MKHNGQNWNSIFLFDKDILGNLVDISFTTKKDLKKGKIIKMGMLGFPSKISQILDAKIYVMENEQKHNEFGIIIFPKKNFELKKGDKNES